jgi:hypothetical protein
MSLFDILEKRINSLSPDCEILYSDILVKCDICTSLPSVPRFLKSSLIPFIKVGKRTLFSKKDLLDFLKKNIKIIEKK